MKSLFSVAKPMLIMIFVPIVPNTQGKYQTQIIFPKFCHAITLVGWHFSTISAGDFHVQILLERNQKLLEKLQG